MSAGLKQFADGAKGLYDSKVAPAVALRCQDFFDDKVAPTARNAAERVQNEAGAPSGTMSQWIARAPMILPVVAFLAIIALFLPVGSVAGFSVNFFDDDARVEGIMLTVLFLGVIAASGWLLVTRPKIAAVATMGISAVAGAFGILDGFGNMIRISGQEGASVGIGVVLLGLLGACLVLGAGLTLLGIKNYRSASTTETPPAQF